MKKSFLNFPKWLLLLPVIVLVGCAQLPINHKNIGVSPADLHTESDNTPARIKAAKRLELSMAYLQDNKLMYALDNVKQAIQDDPTYLDALNVRGLIYMRLNESQLAEDSFKQALRLNDQNSDLLNNYAWFLCQQKRYSESFTYFDRAIKNPRNTQKAKALANLGTCQLRDGKAQFAEKSFLSSYQIDGENPYIIYSLAQLYWNWQNYQQALYFIDRLNQMPAANAQSLWLQIKIERALGDKKAMQQLGNQLSKRFANSQEAENWKQGKLND